MSSLWSDLVVRHDVDIYRFFKSKGMPKPQYFKRFFGEEDNTFEVLFHGFFSGISESEASEIEAFLCAVLDDGWQPRCGSAEPAHLARIEVFLMGQMPASADLLERFAQAGFFDFLTV